MQTSSKALKSKKNEKPNSKMEVSVHISTL